MKFCRFCGSTLPNQSNPKFCPKCGKNISTRSKSETKGPGTAVKQNLVNTQPDSKKADYRTQVGSRPTRKKIQMEEKKQIKEIPIELSSQQAQIVYNQKLSSILTRIGETSNSLANRESYQIADHKAIMLQLDELNELKVNSLFEKSNMEHLVEQTILDSSEVILRISEFLTSHLSSFGLEQNRVLWYQIKEKQAHLELDIERIELLKEDSNILEKNFNILSYRLESSSSSSIERSVIFASYPQVHHYYISEIKKIIPIYLTKIDESGFYSYYKNEKKLLLEIQNYFENPDRHRFAPIELYAAISNYLETRSLVNKKIKAKVASIEKNLIEGYQQYKKIRNKYIQIMNKALNNTPLDVLLMRDIAEENIIDQQEIIIQDTISKLSELIITDKSNLTELLSLNDLKETSKLEDLKDFSTLSDMKNLI